MIYIISTPQSYKGVIERSAGPATHPYHVLPKYPKLA